MNDPTSSRFMQREIARERRRRTREPLLLRVVGWLVLLRKTKRSSMLGKLYLWLSARQGRGERRG